MLKIVTAAVLPRKLEAYPNAPLAPSFYSAAFERHGVLPSAYFWPDSRLGHSTVQSQARAFKSNGAGLLQNTPETSQIGLLGTHSLS